MDTDEVSEVYTYSGLEEQGMFWFWDAAVADNVLYIPNGQRDENGNVIQSCITAIDLDTKEESVIFESSYDPALYISPVDTETYLEKPENSRMLDLVTENYRLSTGITAAELLFADENRAVLMITSDKNILHTL